MLFFVVSFVLLAMLVFAWTPLRMRGLRIDVHAGGIVVDLRGQRRLIVFDEVWVLFDSRSWAFASPMTVHEIRLVCRNGMPCRIPLDVERADAIYETIIRCCSNPLRADALRALRSGETLTFGKVELDRMGIRSPRWSAQWRDVRLVRCMPDRIVLFRNQTVFPWRTIRLDRVPHATIFTKLVHDCARKVEVCDPMRWMGD